MLILSIETSCDETAVSIVRAESGLESPVFTVLGNALYSQIAVHAEYGGVYPNLAKREHGKNLIPLLEKALKEADLLSPSLSKISPKEQEKIIENLKREGNLADDLIAFLQKYKKPDIDMIAVTSGPGLEPALWVGISLAKTLAEIWDIPVIGQNHMKGHIASVLSQHGTVSFPAIALLISGGHTEIVYIERWGVYKILGKTRDDAVGEAFDKVARMLDLPYPGGPQISKLAVEATGEPEITLPRPMIHSGDLDFSFSGLKTSVLYTIRDLREPLSDTLRKNIAKAFQDAVVDVLVTKTEKALIETSAKTLIIAGGVIANERIREAFSDLIIKKYPDVTLKIPEKTLATDNAIMIAFAAYLETLVHPEILKEEKEIIAEGNLSL